jgi:hypothetical protein
MIEMPVPFWAIETGRELALEAMAAGASAEEAVGVAIRFSVSCGGLYQRVESELIRRGVDAEPELRGLAPTAVAEEMSDAQ